MKTRRIIIITVLALCLLLPLAARADECPQSADGKHVWSDDWTVDWDANCGFDGQMTRKCIHCGAQDMDTAKSIPATGDHQFGEWYYFDEADKPTCFGPGKETRWCTVCQKKEERTVPATDHQYTDWSVDQEATCTEAGSRTRTCLACQKKETETIPAKGHTPVSIPAVAATCTEAGKTEGSQCSVCGAVLTAQEDVPAKGHKWSAWEPAGEGKEERTCSRCGTKQQRDAAKQEEAGLVLTCEKVTRQEPSEGYTDVYLADMKLENTGTVPLHFAVEASYGIGDGIEVITDDLVGLNYNEAGIVQPGETFSFQYLVRTSPLYYDGERRVVTRLVYAGGWSDSGLRAWTNAPVVIILPSESGLLLTVDNIHRSGTGTDQVFTFDLTLTNQATGWSVFRISATDFMGKPRDGDQYAGWPEEGLLLGYGQSHSFSFTIRPTEAEVAQVTEYDSPLAWIGRYVTVKDLQGHTAEVTVTGKLQTTKTAEAFLDVTAELPDHLCQDESASVPVSLTLTNIGDIPLTDPVVRGVLMTGGNKTLQTFTLTPADGVTVLQPQESAAFTATVSVGPEDCGATLEDEEYRLRFVFFAEFNYEHPEEGPAHGESNIWQQTVPVWELTQADPRSSYVAPVLTVIFEDREYHPGEKAFFDLKVENVNPEDTIEGIRFEWYPVDEQGEIGEPIECNLPDVVLKPGESYVLEGKYYFGVDQEEALKGVIVLDFHAWCHSASYDWYVNSDWSGLLHLKAD